MSGLGIGVAFWALFTKWLVWIMVFKAAWGVETSRYDDDDCHETGVRGFEFVVGRCVAYSRQYIMYLVL
jgi:hypothetical protein